MNQTVSDWFASGCVLTIVAHTPWFVALSAMGLVWLDPNGTRHACDQGVSMLESARDLLTNTTK